MNRRLRGLRSLTAIAPLTAHLALVLLPGLASLAAPRAAAAAEPEITLQVFAAASLSDAFNEIARLVEGERKGLRVRLVFAGSQQLAAQIEQGAQADVFASADERWMAYVKQRGHVAGDASVFARNTLAVIVPKTNPARIGRLQDLARGGVKLVVGATSVPVGAYSRIVLKNLAQDPAYGTDFATRVLKNVVSEEENVKSVVGKVQLGEADAGMVYISDVTKTSARYIRSFDIPAAANVVAAYPIAVLRDAREEAHARVFVARVLSSEGQAILEKHRFLAATTE